ncbi:alkaline phosphatase D family protein [Actinophytocola xanthii]|uniref:Phosphodiesterase n=1 Tax=Actinophytocola xanthii TaxID=1912961 RepID=A0A1Q8CMH1_9PSEU|nr:alkaline phosphatase D family protein [Actinophytocola xanthii]OLF15573.1 phosphodiesterase [Actinophytocola xanthii]
MPKLLLGPLLRHTDTTSATIWVETDQPCTVTVSGPEPAPSAHTFTVAGHHYALVVIAGLTPATSTPYQVLLDDEQVWPLADSSYPPSRIRTFPEGGDPEFLLLFGSCRMPDSDDPKEMRTMGTDALAAYATRMHEQDERDWPDSLLLVGDQVYADDTTKATKEWISKRRDISKPPYGEVADFEEYTRLYHESWASPLARWLMSTVPTSMIFDDHDVRDDWNTSQAWRDEIERTSWWHDRERGALASYWIYQHIGNLAPDDLGDDEIYEKVVAQGRDGDAADLLREFADRARQEVNGRKGTRWSYRRDFGNVRMLVIDTRSGRILSGGVRSMVGDGEFEWIEQHADGTYDHLLIGSSLPWLMPHAISHIQSMNEVACRRPGWRGRLAEKFRQVSDLEHWPSFRASSDRLTRLILRIAKSDVASVSVLSGDVHHVYAARASFPEEVKAAVFQLTCSPVHNQVERLMRPLFVLAWWRPLAAVFRWLMFRSPHIDPMPVEWSKVSGPFFGNAIASLRIKGRHAEMVVEQAEGGRFAPRLKPLTTVVLTDDPNNPAASPGRRARWRSRRP